MVRFGYGKIFYDRIPIGYLGWLVCDDDGNFCNFGAILAFISDRMIPRFGTLRTSLQVYNGVREFFCWELGTRW